MKKFFYHDLFCLIMKEKKMNRYSYLIFDIPFIIFQFLIFKLHENKNINITMSQNSLIQRFEFYLRISRFYI